MKPKIYWITSLAGTAALFIATIAQAQNVDQLPNYIPVLPQVKSAALAVDPQKGYRVIEAKPGIFMITDGGYESTFVVTGKGVILFDAPTSFAKHIVKAVADITAEPIVGLVYSHAHVDHIGGAGRIREQIPNIEIWAEEGTAEFLREARDPDRPIPTHLFKDHLSLRRGTMTAELSLGRWHSSDGDLVIFLPDRKFLMAVDVFSKGDVPFMGLDLTMNMHEYLKVFDRLLAIDFDVMVPGHLSNFATRDDVQGTKDYVMDVYKTAARIDKTADQKELMSKAVRKYGSDNGYAVVSVLLDDVVDRCAKEIEDRWIKRLAAVDIWAASHCRTALVYAKWDVGPRQSGL